MTYEHNMGEERECDEKAFETGIDIFPETLGLAKPQ